MAESSDQLLRHTLLAELVAFADDQAGEGRAAGEALDPIGLLFGDLGPYACTPTNVLIFARTGGDGTHYSLLPIPGCEPERWPVVMTVPFAFESANHIVGESLRDFLDLGCRHGFFALEQIAYEHERARAIAAIESEPHPETMWPEKELLLGRLRVRFGLQPWPRVLDRLDALRSRFHAMLVVGES